MKYSNGERKENNQRCQPIKRRQHLKANDNIRHEASKAANSEIMTAWQQWRQQQSERKISESDQINEKNQRKWRKKRGRQNQPANRRAQPTSMGDNGVIKWRISEMKNNDLGISLRKASWARGMAMAASISLKKAGESCDNEHQESSMTDRPARENRKLMMAYGIISQ